MPELPEIEVLKRDLEKEVVGRRVKEAEIRPGSKAMKLVKRHGRRKEFRDMLVEAKVEKVTRVGRLLLLDLDNDRVLVFDLAENGRLYKTSASEEIETHTHIVISFTIGGQLRMVDPKLTGEVFVMPKDDRGKLASSMSHPIDPLAHQVTWHHFSGILQEKETALKGLLMDEKFICGLGDLYSDEVLFAAGLRYDRQSNELSSQDVRRLYRALMETLQEAVKMRGTSHGDDPFKDLQGNLGEFQIELKVYGREGEACRRCRHEIEKANHNGHATYFCPQCQS
jgi:formamidopyrimidine-DNA glycosylase